jgi:hypothetical protein
MAIGNIRVPFVPGLLKKTIPTWLRNMGHVGHLRRRQVKVEIRNIYIQGKCIGRRQVEVCTICDGHRPVTKKVADGECTSHPGVKKYLLPLGEECPQLKKEPKKVKKVKSLDPVDKMEIEATAERAEEVAEV